MGKSGGDNPDNVPEGLEHAMKRPEEVSAKIPESMMTLSSYMMDDNPQKAIQQMGNE
jgi:hypothetical protein